MASQAPIKLSPTTFTGLAMILCTCALFPSLFASSFRGCSLDEIEGGNCTCGTNEFYDATNKVCIASSPEAATRPIPTNSTNNAKYTSDSVKQFVLDDDNLDAHEVSQIVDILGTMTSEKDLAVPGVSEDVVDILDKMLDTDVENLTKAQEKNQSSQRLLTVIDEVAERAPLTNGQIKIVSPNIAIAAQVLNPGETRNITFASKSDVLNDAEVVVGFVDSTDSNLRPNGTRVVLPTASLLASVPANLRAGVDRVAFSVLKSDKLFEAMRMSGSNGNGKRQSMRKQINSQVISASVPGIQSSLRLQDNVTLTFQHDEQNMSSPLCVFWDVTPKSPSGEWSSEGCSVVESWDGHTTCSCDHLTNFALLMDVYQEGPGVSDWHRNVLSIISYIGCAVSLVPLLLTIITYVHFKLRHKDVSGDRSPATVDDHVKHRKDTPSKILVNLCTALLIANLIFLVGMQNYTFKNAGACKLVAILLHYFLLSALTWMSVEAFYMYLALVKVFNIFYDNFMLKCSLVGWGIPLVIVGVTVCVNTAGNYGFVNTGLCWIKNPAFYVAFVTPVCVILLLNFAGFSMVIWKLVRLSKTSLRMNDTTSIKKQLKGAIGVSVLLGLCWFFGLLAIDQASVVFYYLFAIFNSLQGLFIFVFHVVFKEDVKSAWSSCLCSCGHLKDLPSSSTAQTAQSTSNTSRQVILLDTPKPKPMAKPKSLATYTTTSTA